VVITSWRLLLRRGAKRGERPIRSEFFWFFLLFCLICAEVCDSLQLVFTNIKPVLVVLLSIFASRRERRRRRKEGLDCTGFPCMAGSRCVQN
jgi:hypothetical protein